MTTATATKKSGKAKATKDQAGEKAAPAVEIPTSISNPNRHVAKLVKLADITLEGKADRLRDAKFEESVHELAAGIARHGLLHPITVMPLKGGLSKSGEMLPEGRLGLVAGERRFRACKLLGWTEIPAVVAGESLDVLEARAAENLQRIDLDEDSKAFTVGRMLDREIQDLCREQGVKGIEVLDAPAIDAMRVAATKRVAIRMGWPVSRVRDYAFAAELPEEVLSLARQGRLSLSHLRILAQVPDPDRCTELAKKHAAGENVVLEPMKPLDELKTDVSRETCRLAGVPWDLGVEFAGGPACNKCPHNSLNRTGLFDGADLKPDFTSSFDASNGPLSAKAIDGGLCSKLSCYRAKTAATKSAWRGAGDRIAAKVADAKPAERKALQAKLVKEAADRCAFVPLTTFGKLAGSRIEQKLASGSSKGKAKASADRSVKSTFDEKRWKAENDLRAAERKIIELIEERAIAIVGKWEPWRRAILLAAMHMEIGRNCFDYGRAKPAEVERFAALLEAIRDKPMENAIAAVAKELGKRDLIDIDLGNLKDMQVLVRVLNIDGIPPSPQLADFLPKPETKKPAADTKSAKGDTKKGKGAKKPAKAKPTKDIDDVDLDDDSGEA